MSPPCPTSVPHRQRPRTEADQVTLAIDRVFTAWLVASYDVPLTPALPRRIDLARLLDAWSGHRLLFADWCDFLGTIREYQPLPVPAVPTRELPGTDAKIDRVNLCPWKDRYASACRTSRPIGGSVQRTE